MGIFSAEQEVQVSGSKINQGYSGENLLKKFRQTQQKIRPAVEAMLTEANEIAESKSGGYSLADIFGTKVDK